MFIQFLSKQHPTGGFLSVGSFFGSWGASASPSRNRTSNAKRRRLNVTEPSSVHATQLHCDAKRRTNAPLRCSCRTTKHRQLSWTSSPRKSQSILPIRFAKLCYYKLQVDPLCPPNGETKDYVAHHRDGENFVAELLREAAEESTWRLFNEVIGGPGENPSRDSHWSEE